MRNVLKFSILISLFFIINSGKSQKPELLFSVPVEKDAVIFSGYPDCKKPFFGLYQHDSVSLYTSTNSSVQLAWTYKLKKEDKLSIIKNSSQKYIQMGSYLHRDLNLTECFYVKNDNEKSKSFVFATINATNGSTFLHDTIVLEKNENYCAHYITDSSFVLITYFENSDNIVIYQKKGKAKTTYYSYLINHEGLGKRKDASGMHLWFINHKIKSISSVFKEPYSVILNNLDYGLISMLRPTKLYFINNEFVITTENEELETNVFRFPLNDTTYTVGSFKHLIDDNRKVKKARSICSSVLVDSLLFMVNVNKKIFHLAIRNINTNSIISDYRLDANDTLNFASSDIKKNGSFFTSKSVKDISVRRMLRRLSYYDESDMGISAFRKDSAIHTIIGASYARKGALIFGAALTGSLAAIASGGSILAGVLGGLGEDVGFFYENFEKENLIYFTADFDNKYCLPTEPLVVKTLPEMIVKTMKENKPLKGYSSFLYPNKNGILLGYAVKETNSFCVFKISY